MSEHKYPALVVTRKTGSEKFINVDIKETLHEFWSWAHSDLCSNAERGVLAEYIVSLALKCADGVRAEWDAYDVHSPENIKVEVKSCAYIQTWTQKKLSNIIFGIRQTHAYEYGLTVFDEELKRQADVYVFCVENCKDQDLVNPFDLNQWDFYVIATRTLDEKFGSQKTLTLKTLEKLGPIGATKCSFSDLRNAILSEYEYQTCPL